MPYKNYYFYILTNQQKTVLYTGVTNNLEQRIIEHWQNRGKQNSFTGKYYAYYLLFYESYTYLIMLSKEKKK